MGTRWRQARTLAAAVGTGLVLVAAPGRSAPTPSQSPPPVHRIALIPVDDRPVNLQDVELAARTAGVELVTPPRSRLGGRDIEGDADGLVEWLDGLDAASVDAAIVSIDMLVYGGTAASQQPTTTEATALGRLAALQRLAARRKNLPISAEISLLPLQPAPEPKRAVVLGKLERWAELAGTKDPAEAAERDRLHEELPPLVLTPYLAIRARNQAVAMAALDLAASGDVSYLVIESREATPKGLSLDERTAVEQRRMKPPLDGRTAVVAAADGVSGLLVARAVNGLLNREPGIEATGDGTQELAAIAGGHRVERAGPHDLVVQVVSAPNAASAADAVDEARSRLKAGTRVALADITGGTGAPGASIPLIEALRNAHLFPQLSAYAGEGAADPTIAAAVTQGLLVGAGLDAISSRGVAAGQLAAARAMAMLHRVTVDFLYQAVVRPQALTDYAPEHRMDPENLDADQVLRMQDYLAGEVKPLAESLINDVMAAAGARRRGARAPIVDIDEFHLTLPWRRLSDPEIRFMIVERPN